MPREAAVRMRIGCSGQNPLAVSNRPQIQYGIIIGRQRDIAASSADSIRCDYGPVRFFVVYHQILQVGLQRRPIDQNVIVIRGSKITVSRGNLQECCSSEKFIQARHRPNGCGRGLDAAAG